MVSPFKRIVRSFGRSPKMFIVLAVAVALVVLVAYRVYAAGPPIIVPPNDGMVSPAMITIPRPGGGRAYRYTATAQGAFYLISRDGVPLISISNNAGAVSIKDPNGNKTVVVIKAPAR